MKTSFDYIVFFTLLLMLLVPFLPVVTELPFGMDDLLIQAVSLGHTLIYYIPFLQTPWNLFQFTLQLMWYIFLGAVIAFIITRGNNSSMF